MIFNSLQFFYFFPVVALLYFATRGTLRTAVLLGANLVFYMTWNVPYTAVLGVSLLMDYSLARWMEKLSSPYARRWLIAASVALNLGLLGTFKYYGFFLDTLGVHLPRWHVLLPLGISFYTFQSMSYTIDVYRRVVPAQRNFLRYAACITFFPQLVAGPIERPTHLLPQFARLPRCTWDNWQHGGQRILVGMMKKVVLADNISGAIAPVFAQPQNYDTLSLWLAAYGFAWRIYWDFSGYSDMAIGLARCLDIHILENFNAPYLATSLQDFWRRWHISLSSWLRDYLYIPLGGSQHGATRTYINLLLTMLLGGLWHGAAMHFVVWGGLHGLGLAVERMVQPAAAHTAWQVWTRRIVVFHGVCIAWVFFCCDSAGTAWRMVQGMLLGQTGQSLWTRDVAIIAGILAVGAGFFALLQGARKYPLPVWWLASAWGVLAIMVFGAKSDEFIYFVF